jgi:hypothetical protein
MDKEANRQFVVGSITDVPPGFIPLAEYGTRAAGKNGTREYEALLDAWRTKRIRACKVMRTPTDKCGPVYVDAKQAAALLALLGDTGEQASRETIVRESRPAADQLQLVGVLRSMLFELRRIGDTMEAYAKRGAVEEWQTTNG